jgi:hypothetical protein
MQHFFPNELRQLDRDFLEPLAAQVRAYLRTIEEAIASKPPPPGTYGPGRQCRNTEPHDLHGWNEAETLVRYICVGVPKYKPLPEPTAPHNFQKRGALGVGPIETQLKCQDCPNYGAKKYEARMDGCMWIHAILCDDCRAQVEAERPQRITFTEVTEGGQHARCS